MLRHPIFVRFLLSLFWVVSAGAAEVWTRAHAHNDYEHARPLFDALDCGFGSIEADVHLVNGMLLVSHDAKDVNPARTLEALYLAPLRERVRANGGRVYRGGPTIVLLVDVKTEAETTYAALDAVLPATWPAATTTRCAASCATKFRPPFSGCSMRACA